MTEHEATVTAAIAGLDCPAASLEVWCSCGTLVAEVPVNHGDPASLPLEMINGAMTAHLVWADSSNGTQVADPAVMKIVHVDDGMDCASRRQVFVAGEPRCEAHRKIVRTVPL